MRVQIPTSAIRSVIEAANRGDVEGMVARFAEDAALTLNPPLPGLRPVYRGRKGIREFLQHILGSGFHVEHGGFQTSGDDVRWRSTVSGGLFASADIEQARVSSHAVVQEGLIRTIDIHYSPVMVRRLEATLAERV